MLFQLKGDIQKHRPLNDDLGQSQCLRGFCDSTNNYPERVKKLFNEVRFCFEKFEKLYDEGARGGKEFDDWQAKATAALGWLMRAIADDQFARDYTKKAYLVATNRQQFETTVKLLHEVPFGMTQPIEFLTLCLWLGWVDEKDYDEAARMFGVIMDIKEAKRRSHIYYEELAAALPKALKFLNDSTDMNKVECAYCAYVTKCGEGTGGDNALIINYLRGAWVRMTDPVVLMAQMRALPLLRNGSSAAYAYIGEHVSEGLVALDAECKSLIARLGSGGEAHVVRYSGDLRLASISVVRRYALYKTHLDNLGQLRDSLLEDAKKEVRRWREKAQTDIAIHIDFDILNYGTKVSSFMIDA